MKTSLRSHFCVVARYLSLATLLAAIPLNARVLDNFDDNVKTAWSDTLQGGSVVESGGQFTISTFPGFAGQIFTASTKTSETFTIEDGRTLEFRVDLVSSSLHNESFAVLVWVPVAGSISSLQGYGFAKGRADILISKALNQYFFADDTIAPGIKHDNVILVLRLTGSGANVIVNVRVLDKDDNNKIIFEQTVTDTPGAETAPTGESPAAPYIGQAGRFALLNFKDTGATDSVIVLDNAQVFDSAEVLVDDFNDNVKTGWTDTLNGGSVTETNMQFQIITVPVATPSFTGSRKSSQSFTIEDGGRVELSVDVISATEHPDAYAVLAWIPTANSLSALAGYGFAKSSDDVLLSKALNQYFTQGAPALNVDNYRMVYSLTGEGANVRLDARLEDLDLPINDANRVFFQISAVDTPASETAPNGETPPTSYVGTAGHFVLIVFNGGGEPGGATDMIFDNARVSYSITSTQNVSASISDVLPVDGANFVNPTNKVSFTVSDDKTIPIGNIELFLNGVRHTNGSPGFTVGGSPNNRMVMYSGLGTNVNYAARIRVTDSDLQITTNSFSFDTFNPEGEYVFTAPTTNDTLIIESEDYNYSSGTFIDFNTLVIQPEPTADTGSYNQLPGTAEIDFHDTQNDAPNLEESRHRQDANLYNGQSTDFERTKYTDAGGAAAMVYDYMIRDIAGGEWLNYTKTFPAGGTYNVYLRQAQFVLASSLVVLEKVTGDPTMMDQMTIELGSFVGKASGFEAYRNVLLTDGNGQPVVLRLSGLTTLRVSQRITGDILVINPDDADAFMRQNYLVFIPAPDPGVLRAFVSAVTPVPGQTLNSIAPVVTATIVNRDTTVNVGTVQLLFDGTPVATGTANANGASVSYTLPFPLPPPNTTHTNTLIFQDSGGVFQTNRWTFTLTYNFLRGTNCLPLGSLSARGFSIRLVQTNGPALGNSLTRAEQQLAIPPTIPFEVMTQVVAQVINYNETGGGAGFFVGESTGETNFPGLPAGDYNNIAIEVFAYLELSAGPHRFGVVSDDGFQLRSGTSLSDPSALVLGSETDGTFNGTFEFVVEQTCLYPVRFIWFENDGGANVELFSVDLGDPNARILINDPANPAGVVKAWVPIRLASSAVVTGPYTFETAAVVNPATKTITVPQAGATRFYRISSGVPAVTITSISLSGGNVVITYQ